MSAHAIINDLVACGAAPRLTPDGTNIVVRGNLSADLRQRVVAHKGELLRLLRLQVANDPTPDPGHARLLTLAQAYCDRTGTSPQARAQWVQDVEGTPPEQRAELYQHLRTRLPPAPRPAPAALPPTPPAPRVWLHLDQAWRRLDALYLAHHWQCTTCCTAGAGRGTRCDVGQRLHDQLAQAVRSA